MTEHKESTSNSIKFAPMPMAALLASLMPLKKSQDSHESSFASGDESDNSFVGSVIKGSTPGEKINKDNFTSATKSQPKYVKAFASANKVAYNIHDKENFNHSLGSKLSCSVKDNPFLQSVQSSSHSAKEKPVLLNGHTNVHPPKEKSLRSLESAHKEPINDNVAVEKTSEDLKTDKNKLEMKCVTKEKYSEKDLSKLNNVPSDVPQNRDRVRCELFAQNQHKDEQQISQPLQEPVEPKPILQAPVPETPLNRRLVPMSCTPSQPQGIVNNNSSKIQFRTICIKDKKYMFIKKLGVGGSSEVYKVLEVGTACEYAVKSVYLAAEKDLAQGYINEVRLLRDLQKSDRVIRLYDYDYDRSTQMLRIVLEVGETDLSSFLKARGAGLPPALVLHYWEEMLQAVHYIHEHGVIHADLKPANFLLVCGRLKLIDFGIASAISSDATSVVRTQAAGTYSYISPEALTGGAGGYSDGKGDDNAPIKISFRSDVWSLGCILYSMVYGRTPFGHIPNVAKLSTILDPNHRIDYPPANHLPPSLIAALKWCLTYIARSRPSVRQLLDIPYLQPTRVKLPQPLLDKLQPLVTPEEFQLLQRALV